MNWVLALVVGVIVGAVTGSVTASITITRRKGEPEPEEEES